jgi:uncharacterized membrane protein YdjX (TVP38/TMEM64 family)
MNERLKSGLKFLALIVFIAFLWYSQSFIDFPRYSSQIQGFLKNFPLIYSSLLYIVLYVIVTFFVLFSKDAFWILGAVIFRPGLSTLLISISEVINAFVLFSLSRKLGRGFIEKNTPGRYRRLDDKLGKINFAWLLAFRVAPLIPYKFMDLSAGLTKIDIRKYLVAAALGTPLKMFWIQYILFGAGKNALSDPDAIVGYLLGNKIILASGAIYLILVILVIIKMRSKD